MRGFKQIDQLSLEECFSILTQQEENPLYEEVKNQFVILASALSLEKSYGFVNQYKDNAENSFYLFVVEHYKELVAKRLLQEKSEYSACRTIEDFEEFVEKYDSLDPAYKAVLMNEARSRIVELREEKDYVACGTITDYEEFVSKYTSMAPEYKAKHINDAQEAIRRKKRNLLVVLGCVVLFFVMLFAFNYKPVKALEIGDVEFGKEGGTKEVRISTNVSSRAVDVILPNKPWLKLDRKGLLFSLTAEPNEDQERSCTIEVTAYATFFGNRLQSKKVTKTVIVSQRSGYAIKDIKFKPNLNFSQYGGEERVNVKTDGVKLQLTTSNKDWIIITPKEQRHNAEYYHDDDYIISVRENPNEGKTGIIKVETGGRTDTIFVKQESGYASEIQGPSSLTFKKFGSSEEIDVKTDGVNLQIIQCDSWITWKKVGHKSNDKFYNIDSYRITVGVNDTGKKSGKITFQSGNVQKEVLVTQESGLAKKLSVDKEIIDYVSIKGGSFLIKVDTDGTKWSVESNRDWLHAYQNGQTVQVTVDNNENGFVKEGAVTIKSNNGHSRKVIVKQDGNPSSFYAHSSKVTFDTNRDVEYISITNNSHQPVYVESDKSWLKASVSGGGVSITCESNDTPCRNGKVKLICGNRVTSIDVHQKGWATCYNCTNGWVNCDNYSASWTFDNWGNWGHGYVSFDGWGNRYVTACSRCGGTGKITCPKCGGTGRIKCD